MSETVLLDFELKSPIHKVWRALTDSATLSRWMMFRTNDFKPIVGHTFQFSDSPGFSGVIDCEVIDVEEPHRLTYTWVTGGVSGAHSTVVTWTLAEGEGGVTRLHLEQSGFRTGAKQEIGGARYGWTIMIGQLQGLLDAEQAGDESQA